MLESRSLHKITLAIVFSYVLISHILLPQFNDYKDFLFFSHWSLFSSPPSGVVSDIMWQTSSGETYLFRDHRQSAKRAGVNIGPLFYLVKQGQLERIRNDHLKLLTEYCQCSELIFIKFKGSLYQHIVEKSELMSTDRVKL